MIQKFVKCPKKINNNKSEFHLGIEKDIMPFKMFLWKGVQNFIP